MPGSQYLRAQGTIKGNSGIAPCLLWITTVQKGVKKGSFWGQIRGRVLRSGVGMSQIRGRGVSDRSHLLTIVSLRIPLRQYDELLLIVVLVWWYCIPLIRPYRPTPSHCCILNCNVSSLLLFHLLCVPTLRTLIS